MQLTLSMAACRFASISSGVALSLVGEERGVAWVAGGGSS